MKTNKFAKWCGIGGMIAGFLYMGFFYWNFIFNPFGFPVEHELNTGNLAGQALFLKLNSIMWFAMPGLVLSVFTIWSGWVANLVVWVIAALLNGPIYYCAGLALGFVTKGSVFCYTKAVKRNGT